MTDSYVSLTAMLVRYSDNVFLVRQLSEYRNSIGSAHLWNSLMSIDKLFLIVPSYLPVLTELTLITTVCLRDIFSTENGF
jgi:hypothetical protein